MTSDSKPDEPVPVANLRTHIEGVIREHYGPRCKDYFSGCVVCARYRSADVLLAAMAEDIEDED